MLTKLQIKDSEECDRMQERGEDKECFECSCSVCIAQIPIENNEEIIKQFVSYAQKEGVIDKTTMEKLVSFLKHYVDSIDS
jgi:hypothetical protein